MGAQLSVEGLSRTFDAKRNVVHALRDVSFEVSSGELVGVLGLNGAGKTTMIKIIATLLLPTDGRVRIDGVDVAEDPVEARRRLGVVFGGDRGLYGRLTAVDNIRFFATLSGVSQRELDARLTASLRSVGLEGAAHRRVETYSKGMRQRLHLAIGLISEPDLLLLDEPTVGLDPLEAERLRGVITDLRDRGVTILLTSHYLHDIERLASRVVVLREGRITHDMPLQTLLRQSHAVATVRISGKGPAPAVPPTGELSETGGAWHLRLAVKDWDPQSLRRLADLWPEASDQRQIIDVSVEPVSLERVFSELASRQPEPHDS